MKNKNIGNGQCEEYESIKSTARHKSPSPAGAGEGGASAPGEGRGGKDTLGGRFGLILTFSALTALGLAGCMSTPHTTIAGRLNGSPFLIEAPKDGDLTGFDLTADSNGVIRVHIDHLAVKMNPEVIGQTGSAEAGNHVWSSGPFSETDGGFKQLERLNERAQPLVSKPSRPACVNMRAGRKGEQHFYRCIRRQPFLNVRSHPNNIPFATLAGRVFDIHTVGEEAGFCPRYHHVSGAGEQTDNYLPDH